MSVLEACVYLSWVSVPDMFFLVRGKKLRCVSSEGSSLQPICSLLSSLLKAHAFPRPAGGIWDADLNCTEFKRDYPLLGHLFWKCVVKILPYASQLSSISSSFSFLTFVWRLQRNLFVIAKSLSTTGITYAPGLLLFLLYPEKLWSHNWFFSDC